MAINSEKQEETRMKDLVNHLLHWEVTITFHNDFNLNGKISSLNNDGILFTTKQKTTWISFREIKMIDPLEYCGDRHETAENMENNRK